MTYDSFFDDLDAVLAEPMPVHTEEEQRRMAYQRAAEDYSRKFDEAYERREIRAASERAHFLNIVLPAIKAAGKRNSGTVPGHAVA